MKTVECFQTVHYMCPDCEAKNSIRANRDGSNPFVGFCRYCKKVWSLAALQSELIRSHGSESVLINIIHPRLNISVIEFDCDRCGTSNAIIPSEILICGKVPGGAVSSPIYPNGDTKVEEWECSHCGEAYKLEVLE